MRKTKFDDKYATCENTYTTLRIYFDKKPPEWISDFLGLRPTSKQTKGEKIKSKIKGRDSVIKMNGWFLETEKKVVSKDNRRHLDFLLKKIIKKSKKIKLLIKSGAKIDIFCYWCSAYGHGGPILSPRQIKTLSTLDIEIGFDIYFM